MISKRPELTRYRDAKIMTALFFIAQFISCTSRAETVWLTERPSSPLTTKQAMARVKSGDNTVYECREKVIGDNMRPRAAKNTKNLYFATVPTAQDDAAEARLSDGKTAVECREMRWSKEKKRLVRAD